MIKWLAEKMLRSLAPQITRMPDQQPLSSAREPSNQGGLNRHVEALANDPLDANLHLQYAIEASAAGQCYLALAELKTAEYLGASTSDIEALSEGFKQALPDPKFMSHNVYFRLISLSSEIIKRAGSTEFSILDVGGGDGRLASFLPNASYCLAEPAVNGISGTDLPFPDRSFDYVVSCHVLEHIPVDQRTRFLDQMVAKTKQGVIILNPFHVEGTHPNERLKLFIEITGAQWAKEHLNCTLPHVDDIRRYANDRGLPICVKPNGTLTTSVAFVFLDHFAGHSKRFDDWAKVNAFFNEKYTDILDSSQYPNSYLIYLGCPETRSDVAGIRI